jgi:hypothetical protein
MNKQQAPEASPMERSATIKANDLPPAERRWIAAVLQVDLADEDEFTTMVPDTPWPLTLPGLPLASSHETSCRSALASRKSTVSNPSVNQP